MSPLAFQRVLTPVGKHQTPRIIAACVLFLRSLIAITFQLNHGDRTSTPSIAASNAGGAAMGGADDGIGGPDMGGRGVA